MLATPSCPICASCEWLQLGQHHYQRHLGSGLEGPDQIRRDIFFDLWLKTGEDEAALHTHACARCGFVTYMPRPEHADVENKYKYLAAHTDTSAEFTRDLSSDLARSRDLYRNVRRLLPTRGGEVLDFGGGKGRLLYALVKRGHACYVCDYVDHVIDGARFLGADLDKIAQEHTFDLVVCSHVIEHVADPVGVLRKLAAVVTPGGHLYVEVPLELWNRVPPTIDPITHINFFTRESLQATLETAGYDVSECRYETFVRPNGLIGMAVKAVAQPGSLENATCLKGTQPLAALMRPSPTRQLARLLRHPRLLLNIVSLLAGRGGKST